MRRDRKKRTYNPRLVKRDFSYTIEEIAELFGLHENSVRLWLKEGLPTIDAGRPTLIHGSDLIAFIRKRQTTRKHPCAPDEFYCCRCRKPRRAWESLVDLEIRPGSKVLLKAVCEVCGGGLNKAGAQAKLAEYRRVFDVQTAQRERLMV
jgi:hypothetical protein